MSGLLYARAKSFVNEWKAPWNSTLAKTISVIIPVYHPYHLDSVVEHLSNFKEVTEIILVDDSGEFNIDEYENVLSIDKVQIFFHEKNLGRPATRNTGAAKAKGELIAFVDQDMFLHPDFFSNALKYFSSNSSLVYLGLRCTVPFKQIPNYHNWISHDYNDDWRMCTTVNKEFIDLTISGCGHADNNCKEGQSISILNQTEHLQKLGIHPDKTIGFWDLPCMVISHSMMMAKNDFLSIGGFPEWISGWGGEDIVLGFLACAKHIPIYLDDIVSYQAEHNPYSGSEEAKIKELSCNIKTYKNWAVQLAEYPKFNFLEAHRRGLVINFT